MRTAWEEAMGATAGARKSARNPVAQSVYYWPLVAGLPVDEGPGCLHVRRAIDFAFETPRDVYWQRVRQKWENRKWG